MAFTLHLSTSITSSVKPRHQHFSKKIIALSLCVLTSHILITHQLLAQESKAATSKASKIPSASQAKAQHYNSSFNLQKTMPFSSKLIKGTLANGLTYYIQENKKPEHAAELRLVVKAGSVLEDEDQLGLAHFVEHMAFNGTRDYKKNELVSELEKLGIKMGADLNAYTSFNETVYILPIPTTKPENMEIGMKVLSNWADGVTFDSQEIDKERGVVLEEERSGKGASERMMKQILPYVFHGSKYASRLPIGTADSLKNFQADSLKRFYRDWYRPNLMAVIAVGNINAKQTQALVQHYFGKLKNPTPMRPRPEEKIPLHNVDKTLVITDKEANNASIIGIASSRFHWAETPTYGFYRQELVRDYFNRLIGQRLHDVAQQANAPFMGASTSVSRNTIKDHFELQSMVAVGKAGVKPAIDALVKENLAVAQWGFQDVEFQRVKADMLSSNEHNQKEKENRPSDSYASEFIRHFLLDESLPGDAEYDIRKQFLKEVSLKEVDEFAKQVLQSSSNELITYMGNTQPPHPLPSEEQLKAWVKEAKMQRTEAHQEAKLNKKLIENLPPAGKITQEKQNAQLGSTHWVLSNGIQVILKPTTFKNDEIIFTATRKGGMNWVDDADFLQARYMLSAINAMGIKNFTPNELSKFLSGKEVSFNVSYSNYFEEMSGASTKKDLPLLFELMLASTQNRIKDEQQFSILRDNTLASIANIKSSPQAIYGDAIQRHAFKPSARLVTFDNLEDIKKVDLDKVLALFKSRFSNPYGLQFVFVGSFTVEEMKPLIEKYLAGIPTSPLTTEFRQRDVGLKEGRVEQNIFAGKENKSFFYKNYHGLHQANKEEKAQFQALIEILQLRLTQTIREELGASYSPRVTSQLSRVPPQRYEIQFHIECAPENISLINQKVQDLVAQIQATGVKEEELNKTKENWLKNFEQSKKTNSLWLNIFLQQIRFNEPEESLASYENRLRSITTEQVNAVAKKYLNTPHVQQFVLYPEKSQ